MTRPWQLVSVLGKLVSFEDGLDAVAGPEKVFALDGEWRSEADDVVVSLLAEQAFAHEGFADGTSRAVELDGYPETAATNLSDLRAVDLADAFHQ
jgi:hypothetical protein